MTAARAAAEVVGPPTRVVLRVIFIIIFVAVVLWIVFKLTGVILVLVLSIFFAYLVSRLVDFIRRPRRLGQRELKIPRGISILIAYLLILAQLRSSRCAPT